MEEEKKKKKDEKPKSERRKRTIHRSSPESPVDEGRRSKRRKDSHRKSSHSSHPKEKKHRHRDKHKVSTLSHELGDDKRQQLSTDDYYSKNNEFATWLKEEKSLFFADLSAESARDLFSQFVSRWNANKLEPRYYQGIASGPRTSHKWKIKN